MSAIKAKQENKIILDLSNHNVSKNQLKNMLRTLEVRNQYEDQKSTVFINNLIKVGMYTIKLWLPLDASPNWTKLKQYNDLQISIYEENDLKNTWIVLHDDSRFNTQYWVYYNYFGKLRIKHLLDILLYCQRLNNLRAFL
mgnify:CR=1 FL=1